ncbi:MAG: DUF2892 domain-containing protein [Marinospirillum sp.]|uniref:YgaP family membrane protein n=1 Tax=Marinospirillum sp. TaxID=2183934 RepID=UPI0019E3DC51|nr:DUF2892 domain-containing protein [Marinospirillum sp.]MBE0508405.1 DUF2892 domain-containing protein [Marinospirillum sp.]
MSKNVGTLDKGVRLILALLFFAAGFYYQSVWGLVGLIPLVTALVGWCPLYRLLGLSSCKAK